LKTIYYNNHDFRHANSLLKKAKQGDEDAVNAIFGTFTCQASNIAGTGEKCSISIDGPPSALVAETDTTYLIFGGAAVLVLLSIIITSIVVCRRHRVSKYDTGVHRTPEEGPSAAGSTGQTEVLKNPAGPAAATVLNRNTNSSCSSSNNNSLTRQQQQVVVTGPRANGTYQLKPMLEEEPDLLIEPIMQQHHQNGAGRNNGDCVNSSSSRMQQQQPDELIRGSRTRINLDDINAFEMRHNPSVPAPPPPCYRRVPPPTHMMTLDRRVAGHVQHRLIPMGCDVTLNRRQFNPLQSNGDGNRRLARAPEELWLV
jgi:hypothetical protein